MQDHLSELADRIERMATPEGSIPPGPFVMRYETAMEIVKALRGA